jgi:hypothetical protein
MEASERRLRMPDSDDIHGHSLNNERGTVKPALGIEVSSFNITSDDPGP